MTPTAKAVRPIDGGERDVLDEQSAPADPVVLFGRWFRRAKATSPGSWFDPTAMTLATADSKALPAARIVLLKQFGRRGFVFYTNYGSSKGRQLAVNPQAACVFYWPHLRRQVRIIGRVARVSLAVSRRYFHARPRGSQLGAAASRQSRVIASRQVLESKMRALRTELAGKPIPLPPDWGGYLMRPRSIEFWQSQPDRLHDRLVYTWAKGGKWRLQRLSP